MGFDASLDVGKSAETGDGDFHCMILHCISTRPGLIRKTYIRFLLHRHAELVLHDPAQRHVYVLLDDRHRIADHPALLGAGFYRVPDPLRFRTVPNLREWLISDIPHGHLFVHTVAGEHVTRGIDKTGLAPHLALKKALVSLDVVHQAIVEVGPEPFLGRVRFKEFANQLLKLGADHFLIRNFVVELAEIMGVVQRCRGKLVAQGIRQRIEREKILAVHVLHRHPETDILQPHLAEGEEGPQSPVKTVRDAPDLVIGFLQAFDADPDACVRVGFAEDNDPVGKVAVSADDNAVGLFSGHADDFLDVLTHKRLAAGDVDETQAGGELFDILHRDFLGRLGRVLKDVAHIASGVAAVGNDNADFLWKLKVVVHYAEPFPLGA